LLESHLEGLTRQHVKLAYEVDLPLLKHLQHFSDEQIQEFSRTSFVELLQYLAQNKAKEYIEQTLEKWKTNQFEIIESHELVAEDITLLNFIRGKVLRKFIPQYTNQVKSSLQLVDELDSFLMGLITASFNTYIILLKEEIARHEKELLEAQAIAHIGNFDWDLITGKTNNSPEIYKIFELEPGIGLENFLKHVLTEDRNKVDQAMASAMEHGEFDCEFRYEVNGKVKYIWSKGVVLQDSHGKSVKFIGTVQDFTRRRNIEMDLLEKTRALERSNASLEEFAYAASHDLKEPIRKVHLYLDRLETSLLPHMSQEEIALFDKLKNANNRMQLLVDDLLEYSHVSLRPKEMEIIDLNNKLQNVLGDLEVSINEKQAHIKIEPLPVIRGYRRQLQQLFQNLISNALKYSRLGIPPQIEISCREVCCDEISQIVPENKNTKEYYLIEVKDNGIGFASDEAEKIFQVFQRLHGRAEYAGSGVGLSIARKVAENHHGYILAEGVPGEGATFKVYLPIQSES
jgi:hypothetical protein